MVPTANRKEETTTASCYECHTQSFKPEFSNCMTEQNKHRCNYAILFCEGYLCTHPNHRSFS